MAFVLASRVRETTTTVGTGAITLDGPFIGFQSFATGVGDNNTTYYAIANLTNSEWEVGVGTYSLASNSLVRDSIIQSSNSDEPVNFGAGTKDIICTMPAERSVFVSGGAITASSGAQVPNALLANSTITIGTTTVALGGSVTSISGLTLVNPTFVSLDIVDAAIVGGSINNTVIGNALPAAATFTTLTSTSTTVLNGTTIPPSTTLATTSTAQTLSNKLLVSPRIQDAILDVNSNDFFLLTATPDAVNSLNYANAATGGAPTFTADGADGNIAINFVPRGTGTLQQAGVDVVTTSGTQTLTNKSISASQITGTVPIAQGGTAATTAAAARVSLGIETSATGSTLVAKGTSAERDGSPATGYLRFNTQLEQFEGYNGTTWDPLGAGELSGDTTIGTTTIPLNGASTTLAGLTSVTSDAFVINTRATNAPLTDNDLSFDLSARNNFSCTPSGAGTLTFTNIPSGQSGFIKLVNTSNHTISAAATTKIATASLTAISATGTYIMSYFSDGTNVYVSASGDLT
jgi:hypothetical protein